MTYQPNQCERKHRLVILRKNISVQKGERVLFDEVRYFVTVQVVLREAATGQNS
jgi:hypothetical protein